MERVAGSLEDTAFNAFSFTLFAGRQGNRRNTVTSLP
jgi:hypothetical protein